jgi:hypothetical protein
MRLHRSRWAALALATVTTTAAGAAPGPRDQDALQWTLQGGAVYQAESSLDSGGDVSVGRYFASVGAARVVDGRWRVGVSLEYGEDRYDFSGTAGFGGLDPWGDIRELRVSLPVQYFADENWTLYAIPSLRSNAESGASLDDGRNGGLLAGALYRVSDRLSIGPGFGAFSEIEDDASFFPILLVDWKITDSLSLETGGGFAASRGPGLQLRWRHSPRWQFAFGARYEKTRFRLDDSGPAPDGVGEDKAVPLFALAEFTLAPDLKLSLVGGAEVGAELRLEDSSGNRVSSSDLSTAPFFGATLQARF